MSNYNNYAYAIVGYSMDKLLAAVRLAFIERSREGRYEPDKEERAYIMREHRAYKRKLHKEGKI